MEAGLSTPAKRRRKEDEESVVEDSDDDFVESNKKEKNEEVSPDYKMMSETMYAEILFPSLDTSIFMSF